MDRNFILAIALSMAVMIGWDIAVLAPQREAQRAAQEAAQQAAEEAAKQAAAETGAQTPGDASRPQDFTPSVAGDTGAVGDFTPTLNISGDAGEDIDAALASAPGRIEIETPAIIGSLNLAGARIDDIRLKDYREELADDSPLIRLLSPEQTAHGHFVEQGWIISGDGQGAGSTLGKVWTAPSGARLTPQTPLTLTRNAGGVVFERTISVDDKFMFTVEDAVRNDSGETRQLNPFGLVIQRGIPEDFTNFMILHEGPIAVVDKSLFERKYPKAKKAVVEKEGQRGWVGVTNKYWLAAAVPPQGEGFDADLRNVGSVENPIFRATYSMPARALAPGETLDFKSHLYAGVKDVDILQSYEKSVEKGGLGVWDFDKAVDWGNFFFLTRPIFYLLNFFGDLTGNFGLAILLMTLVIKAFLFPLANKGYESMSKMKKLQPEIEKLRARYDDDKMKLQQEMMALYKKEKLNPLAGCLPILIQMPVFYALYKTLFVTLELRHEPFFGWIRDLSAPDPTTIFNLFGLLPFDPTVLPVLGAFLGVGVLPVMMGVAMWFQTKLNPPATDPVQQQVFAIMPFMFTFLFASFAAGLVLYWFWNTALSIAQQWYIMKRNGVEVNLVERLPFIGAKKAAEAAPEAPPK